MSAQQRINQGDEGFVQCHEVSSSDDRLHNICLHPFLRGRPTSRRPLRSYIIALDPLPVRAQLPIIPDPAPTVPHLVNNMKQECREEISTRRAVLSVAFIFLLSLLALFFVYSHFPNVTEEEKKHIKIPWNIEDAKQLGIVLSRYKSDHYYEVMTGVFVSYVFLQTFAIPGSLFLSILAGFLFPFTLALALVCTCSAVGASLCFLLSQLLGRKLIMKYFPDRAKQWAQQVEKHSDNLTNYIIFLRVTPFLPNWFINLSAPVIGVPLVPFAVGTFVGVAPPSFIAIQGGQTLQSMTETDSAFTLSSFFWLIMFGFLSLVPIFLKNRLKAKIE